MSLKTDLIKHQILIDRLSNSFTRDYNLDFKFISQKIQKELDKGLDLNSIYQLRLELRSRLIDTMQKQLDQYIDFAEYETQFLRDRYKVNTGLDLEIPEKRRLSYIIMRSQIKTTVNKPSLDLRTTWAVFIDKKLSDLTRILNDSIVLRESLDITKNKIKDLTSGLIPMHVKLMTSLSVLSVSAKARNEVYALNPDKIQYVQWYSVLEDTTCPYCEQLHNQKFQIGQEPAFPAHARCQCSLLPVE